MTPDPDRVLPLQGASNFRDLGGYRGDGGRPVRWRRVFRADHLGALSAADVAMLRGLRLAHAFDFRGVAERADAPYALPGVRLHSLAIEPTVVQRLQDLVAVGEPLTAARVASLMRDLYRHLVEDQGHRFATLLHHLADDADDGVAVFHCTAGKDRTGLAAALILLALGVSRDDVMRDYLLTNEVYRHVPPARSEIPADALAVLWRVQPDFLETALSLIDAEHGGIDRYLEHRLALTPVARARLRDRLLEA